jgi:hypothetical protein
VKAFEPVLKLLVVEAGKPISDRGRTPGLPSIDNSLELSLALLFLFLALRRLPFLRFALVERPVDKVAVPVVLDMVCGQ